MVQDNKSQKQERTKESWQESNRRREHEIKKQERICVSEQITRKQKKTKAR
jgi:hypothetical protein